jgi:F-type H+-transporting ATPase subunit epsilon
MRELTCIIVTPERTVLDGPAEFLALPLFDGEIGIAPGHSAMIGRLGCGEMRIIANGRTQRLYVEGGFVEVIGNTVSVMTNRALPADQIDEAVAREQLRTALERRADSPERMAVRDRQVAQARAQLWVARQAL